MRMTDIELANYLPVLRENFRLILLVLLVSCLTSFLGTEMLTDDHYWSEAEIQVLYGAGSPIGSQNPERPVSLVRRRMTPASLERIIVENSLYAEQMRTGLAKAVEAMQKDISTSAVRDDAIRLAFRATDPGLAQRVAHELVSQSVSTDGEASVEEDNRVLSNLTDRIKKAEADLAKQEEKVKDFNLRFLGGQLERQTATLATLNRFILQLQSNADLLNALQEQKSSQERLLIQQQSLKPSDGSADSIIEVDKPTPDSLAQSNPTSLSFSERSIKLDEVNREIDLRKKQQAEIRKEMTVYQAKIASSPKVRALQTGIVRDYDKARLHYQELLAKKNQAEITKAAKTQRLPSFKVLSPASFPETPSETRDQFIAKLSGLFWGPLVATGLVRLRSKTREQRAGLEEAFGQSGVPVLASIPWIPSIQQEPQSEIRNDPHPTPTS
jgi:uncharacterized protein involved in exopolysaccharide biosynthesis